MTETKMVLLNVVCCITLNPWCNRQYMSLVIMEQTFTTLNCYQIDYYIIPVSQHVVPSAALRYVAPLCGPLQQGQQQHLSSHINFRLSLQYKCTCICMYISYVMLVSWCRVKDSQAICTPKGINNTHQEEGEYVYRATHVHSCKHQLNVIHTPVTCVE